MEIAKLRGTHGDLAGVVGLLVPTANTTDLIEAACSDGNDGKGECSYYRTGCL